MILRREYEIRERRPMLKLNIPDIVVVWKWHGPIPQVLAVQ